MAAARNSRRDAWIEALRDRRRDRLAAFVAQCGRGEHGQLAPIPADDDDVGDASGLDEAGGVDHAPTTSSLAVLLDASTRW